jgi:anthranilate synthase component II
MSVLIIDNYDSFTFNLVHALEKVGQTQVDVVLNDVVDVNTLDRYTHIVLSPGPGIPKEAGRLYDVIKAASGKIPMLGVCLGHQAMAEVFGGTLFNLAEVFHGVATPVTIVAQSPLFNGIPNPFTAGRYHSWVVKPPLPHGFKILAEDEFKNIMAFSCEEKKMFGVQFHPESVLTPYGEKILENWLKVSS